MRQTIKLIGIAFLGGFLALGANTIFDTNTIQNEKIVDSHSIHQKPSQNINYAQVGNTINSRQVDFTDAANKSIHSVVYILSEFNKKSSVYDDYFSPNDFFFRGQPRTIKASGSGVILSSDGYIVTNNHVVQEASNITVTLNDKREYTAKVIGTDPSTDLALLKIDEKDLPFLLFGNSDEVKVGEWVLAVGNPFNLTSTVTAGIISAKARDINILGSQTSIESFLQTDAVVNPGNSGGALVNTNGELIGVNAAIASRTGNYIGYSFAIPVTIVKKVVNDLKEFGQVQRAYIGVTIQNIDSKLSKELHQSKIKGVLVAGIIEGGAAEKAGISPQTIITKIDGYDVNTGSELLEKVGIHRPGDKIVVSTETNNKTKDYTVVLTDAYGNAGIKQYAKNKKTVDNKIGASFAEIDLRTKQQLRIDNGVRVVEVSNGIFQDAGIRKGFIIIKIDQTTVEKPSDISRILNSKKGGVLVEGIYPNGVKAFYGFGL